MTSPLPLYAQSHADDTAYRTTIDLTTACSHLDWRLVGGIAVHLQQRLLRIEDVPDRATRDADAAIQVAVTQARTRSRIAADLAVVVDSLHNLGYEQVAGNRFVRTSVDPVDTRMIDLLVPGYRSTIQHNQPLPDQRLVVDAVPGLGYALSVEPPVIVDLDVQHLDGTHAAATVPLASVRALLVVKALAWRGRRTTKDALDIWRLLEMEHRLEHVPRWPDAGAAGDARRILQTHARAIGRAATTDPRLQARVQALVDAHVGRP